MDVRKEYRILRYSKGIKIVDVAQYIGCTVGLISNWENNRGYMGIDMIRKYIDYIESK